jgi:lipid A 3-O-deacylase
MAPRRNLLAALLLLVPVAANAQSPRSVRVGADNDAFSFWIPPWDRSDREYTSGVFGTLEYGGRSRWLNHKWLGAAPCENDCATSSHSFSIGQAIYTGTFAYEIETGIPTGNSVGRPNAGWLFVTLADRDSSARVIEERSIAIGVVGPPALAEPMQQLFHALGPEYQRPQDWSSQLPFEPGFVARYMRESRMHEFGTNSAWNGFISRRLGASLGTIHTGASVGLAARLAAPHWFGAKSAFVPRLSFRADGGIQGVLRDEFLDGTFFRSSDHVSKLPAYGEYGVTAELTWSRFGVGYRAAYTGKQYKDQFRPMQWGSFAAEWRP